jgi:4-amino-4-deoxy-L-arabinose transferase-like glycosyltransferase
VTESATEGRRPSGIMARLGETRFAAALLALLALFLLFHRLGGAALFDPDEGRNAEVAREILVTGDWLAPYYNFLPRPEKPVFFYSLTALSYKLFGVSEAAARFPSAASALAIVLLTYFFARRFFGARAALWSGLVLITSAEFYAFSRIVILDMTLAFFIALALFAHFRASAAESRANKRANYFLMYAAVAGATLVKGPIGVVFPGMIVAAYIVAGRNWSALKQMDLGWGVLIFFLIVAPWYAWAEMRSPGYLAYFLGQEHFTRYLTPYFHRTKPWHYFVGVVAIGFLPWTFLLASVARRMWNKRLDGLSLYLLLWAIAPFIFFSFSHSKMAEYLLPIFPALAILAGKILADGLATWEARLFSFIWQVLGLSFLYLLLGLFWPEILPLGMRDTARQLSGANVAALALLALAVLPWTAWTTLARDEARLFPLGCLAFFLLFRLGHYFIEPFSLSRSYKELAVKSAPLLHPGDQLVIYDTHLPTLPFYLQIHRPIWIVADENAEEIMGSFYLAANKPSAARGYGKVLFTFEEFAREWPRRKLMVFVKEKRLSELEGASVLLRVRNVALVTNR